MTPYDIWLDRIPEVGAATILALREVLGGGRYFAEAFYRMSREQREEAARRAVAATTERSERLGRERVRRLSEGSGPEPEQCAQELENLEMRFTVYDDPEYPEKLRNLPDPPFGLYYYGRLPSSTHPSAAIIGTRMASPYGREEARRFARELAREGVQVISGMAVGIDGIAGRGALDVDGDTFAVLGCGADVCYPRANADLYGALFERGGILSEYPPGTEPQRQLFPSRNRIISGLSDVVLVIEAREKSGTLITVDRALEYGVDVFALPGRVSDKNSRGCNELIRQGAGIAVSPQDILDYLFGERPQIAPSEDDGTGQELPCGSRQDGGRGQGSRYRAVQMSLDFEVFSAPGDEMGDETAEEADETQRKPEGVNEMREADAGGGSSRRLAALSKTERAVYDALDESTPQGIDALLPPVRAQMGRNVSYQEVMRTITLLSMKGLAAEVRVGNYISLRA